MKCLIKSKKDERGKKWECYNNMAGKSEIKLLSRIIVMGQREQKWEENSSHGSWIKETPDNSS